MAILLLLLIYLTFISLGLPDSILGSSFPAIAMNLGLSNDMAGYIAMVVSAMTILSSLLSTWLVKRIGSKWVVALSVLLTALALLGFSFVRKETFYLFFVFAIPLGLGAGAIDATLNNYVALHYRALHMNWLHCSWGIGVSISPLLVGAFIQPEHQSQGWDKGILTIALIQGAIALLLFLSLPLWDKVAKKEAKEETQIEIDEENAAKAPSVLSLWKNPVLYLALLGFFGYCALETTTGLWIGSFFHLGKGFSTKDAAFVTSSFYFGITIGRFLAGLVSLKMGEKGIIRIGEGLIGLGVLLIALPLDARFAIAGFVIVGLGCAPIYPAIIRSSPYRFSKAISLGAISFEMAAAYVGNLLMPPLFGLLARHFDNFLLLPYFMLVFLVLMVLCHEVINGLLRKRDASLSPEELKAYR